MNKKCNGCGALFQTDNPNMEGYVRVENIDKDICERCFRIKNYGEYKIIDKSNIDFVPILKQIAETKDLVVLVVDIFGINKNLIDIIKHLNNDILFVFTKRDILPLSVNNDKLIEYVKKLGVKPIDVVLVSSNKNYGFDLLIDNINKYKKSDNVYVVGYTNAGKSTMINKLIYNYSDLNREVTTSILPSTTLNTVSIKINDSLTIIDTPGIIDENSIIDKVDVKTLKRILPNKEIKPITYQIKSKQVIFIDNLVRLDLENINNLTFYFSNQLKIERFYKDSNKLLNLKKHVVRVKENNDVVISGLGFIKVTNNDVITIYTLENVDVYVRDSLI